jgi:hypothetical protein
MDTDSFMAFFSRFHSTMRKGNATNIRIGQTLKYLGCESKHTYKGATYKLIKVAA